MPKFNATDRKKKKVRTVILIPTMACNLNCTYCYEKSSLCEDRKMDVEIAKDAITEYMNADDGFDSVVIDLFGGEPLLAFSFIKEIIEWTVSKEWKKNCHFSIGTNGTLLTEEMKSWFIEYKQYLTLCFSINGNKKAHDLTRDNSFDLLFPHIPFFMENWPGQPAKMTICAENLPYIADSVIELEEMNLLFTANIAAEDFWGNSGQEKNLLDIYEDQLNRLIDYYIEHNELFPPSRILDSLPPYHDGTKQRIEADRCVRFCGAGHEMVAVDVDGTRYPCHRFLPWVTGKPVSVGASNIQTNWTPEKCANCKIVKICPTCAGYNWEVNNDTGIRTTFHCEATKLEVLASAKLEALRLQKYQIPVINSMPPVEQKRMKKNVEVLWQLIEDGI